MLRSPHKTERGKPHHRNTRNIKKARQLNSSKVPNFLITESKDIEMAEMPGNNSKV
jgi:hypothetical protein